MTGLNFHLSQLQQHSRGKGGVTIPVEASGEKQEEYSRRGIAYGADPYLYSGIETACDLIEAADRRFPPDPL